MEVQFLLPAPDEPRRSGTLTQQPDQRHIMAHYHRLAGSADAARLQPGTGSGLNRLTADRVQGFPCPSSSCWLHREELDTPAGKAAGSRLR